MEQTLRVIDSLIGRGIFKAYAIGGGIAATYYIEPILTYDLDIFFVPAKAGIDVLAPIYAYAEKAGYAAQGEMILIEGIPVQFIPVYNDLIREAVDNAATLRYRDTEAKVVTAEYLAAIALQTGRPKDRERVARILEAAVVDRTALSRILKTHGLEEKFKRFEEEGRDR